MTERRKIIGIFPLHLHFRPLDTLLRRNLQSIQFDLSKFLGEHNSFRRKSTMMKSRLLQSGKAAGHGEQNGQSLLSCQRTVVLQFPKRFRRQLLIYGVVEPVHLVEPGFQRTVQKRTGKRSDRTLSGGQFPEKLRRSPPFRNRPDLSPHIKLRMPDVKPVKSVFRPLVLQHIVWTDVLSGTRKRHSRTPRHTNNRRSVRHRTSPPWISTTVRSNIQ